MPIEAVLAMYGYGGADPPADPAAGDANESRSSMSEEDILNKQDLTLDKEEVHLY